MVQWLTNVAAVIAELCRAALMLEGRVLAPAPETKSTADLAIGGSCNCSRTHKRSLIVNASTLK